MLARVGSVISYEYPKLSKTLVFSYIARTAQTIYLLELNSSDGSENNSIRVRNRYNAIYLRFC